MSQAQRNEAGLSEDFKDKYIKLLEEKIIQLEGELNSIKNSPQSPAPYIPDHPGRPYPMFPEPYLPEPYSPIIGDPIPPPFIVTSTQGDTCDHNWHQLHLSQDKKQCSKCGVKNLDLD